jgi:hypothetical protein
VLSSEDLEPRLELHVLLAASGALSLNGRGASRPPAR